VDTTIPVPGEVVDGKEASFTDVQYTTSRAKVEVQWRGYSDPESFIDNYQVQVHRARYIVHVMKLLQRGFINKKKKIVLDLRMCKLCATNNFADHIHVLKFQLHTTNNQRSQIA
jgi:hypothetical protein